MKNFMLWKLLRFQSQFSAQFKQNLLEIFKNQLLHNPAIIKTSINAQVD